VKEIERTKASNIGTGRLVYMDRSHKERYAGKRTTRRRTNKGTRLDSRGLRVMDLGPLMAGGSGARDRLGVRLECHG